MKNFTLWLENQNYSGKISELFANGVNFQDPNILGYHGTSLQTMEYILKNGYLPAGDHQASAGQNLTSLSAYGKDYEDYGIHLTPNPNSNVVRKMEFRKDLVPNAQQSSMDWANFLSRKHNFMQSYDLDHNNPDHIRAAADYTNNGTSHQDVIRGRVPNLDALQGGVVLAVSNSVVSRYKVAMGGDGDDVNIVTKKLPLEYIVGVEPSDDYAYEWLERLG